MLLSRQSSPDNRSARARRTPPRASLSLCLHHLIDRLINQLLQPLVIFYDELRIGREVCIPAIVAQHGKVVPIAPLPNDRSQTRNTAVKCRFPAATDLPRRAAEPVMFQ